MLNTIKMLTKKMFRGVGLEVHGYNPHSSAEAQLVASLLKFEIDLVIDVGANYGQFATGIRRGGYLGKIVSFEPLTSAFAKLTKAQAGDQLWDIYPRCAIGDQDGEVTINIAGNSASSSVLPMLESLIAAAPHTAYIGKEAAKLMRLDSITPGLLSTFNKPFLKIDTQGFEWQVLDGAINTLDQVQGVLLEMSLTPLYEGQYLWGDMLERMEKAGFTLWALQPVFTDSKNGRTYQVDGIFYRTS